MRYAKVFIIATLTGCASGPDGAARQALQHDARSVTEPRLSYGQLLAAAQDALAAGHADAAATLAEDACRLVPDRPEAYLVRGRALAQNDHVGTSSEALEHARALGCRDLALFSALASNYDVEHRYAEAAAVYRDYLTDHPHDAGMRQELGLTLLLLRDTAQGVLQLRAALKLAPTNLQIRQDLGYALLDSCAFAEAEAHLAQVGQAPKAPPEALRLWAQALAAQHKWDAALAVVGTMLAKHPLDSDAQQLKIRVQKSMQPRPGAAASATADDVASTDQPGVCE